MDEHEPIDTTSLDDLGEAPKGEVLSPHQIESPKKTFFYEKNDGTIFACHENEAALFGRNYRFIGVSNGKAYQEVLRAAKFRKGDAIPAQKARAVLDEAFAAELAVARGKFERPKLDNVHFDASFPQEQRGTFVPPR